MKFFVVARDEDVLEEPFATRNGAESFIRICKGIDKVCNRKYIYVIEEVEAHPNHPKEK